MFEVGKQYYISSFYIKNSNPQYVKINSIYTMQFGWNTTISEGNFI